MVHIARKTRDPLPFGPGLNAHRLVASVAIGMAEELFEVYMRSNEIYRRMRANGEISEANARKVFVDRVAPRMLEEARQALTSRLSEPDEKTPAAIKDQIAEALILDEDLRGNRIMAGKYIHKPGAMH